MAPKSENKKGKHDSFILAETCMRSWIELGCQGVKMSKAEIDDDVKQDAVRRAPHRWNRGLHLDSNGAISFASAGTS